MSGKLQTSWLLGRWLVCAHFVWTGPTKPQHELLTLDSQFWPTHHPTVPDTEYLPGPPSSHAMGHWTKIKQWHGEAAFCFDRFIHNSLGNSIFANVQLSNLSVTCMTASLTSLWAFLCQFFSNISLASLVASLSTSLQLSAASFSSAYSSFCSILWRLSPDKWTLSLIDPAEKVSALMLNINLRAKKGHRWLKATDSALISPKDRSATEKEGDWKEERQGGIGLCHETLIVFDKGLRLLCIKAHGCAPVK